MSGIITFLVGLLLVLSLVAVNAQAGTMKLLTPEVGWALAGPGLTWATDGGSGWKNTTPPLPRGEHITSVFFRDTLHGWALLSGPITGSDEPHLDFAATDNAGVSWSVNKVKIPGLNPRSYLLGGGGDIYFVDSLHGWMDLSRVARTAGFAVRGSFLATVLTASYCIAVSRLRRPFLSDLHL